MKKISLTQDKLSEYGTVSEMRILVSCAKELLEYGECFPEELWEMNDKLLEVLNEAHSEYLNYMRKIDQI